MHSYHVYWARTTAPQSYPKNWDNLGTEIWDNLGTFPKISENYDKPPKILKMLIIVIIVNIYIIFIRLFIVNIVISVLIELIDLFRLVGFDLFSNRI